MATKTKSPGKQAAAAFNERCPLLTPVQFWRRRPRCGDGLRGVTLSRAFLDRGGSPFVIVRYRLGATFAEETIALSHVEPLAAGGAEPLATPEPAA